MQLSIRLERGLVVATASGRLGLAEAKKGARGVWNNVEWQGKPLVWDLRSAELNVTSDEVQLLAKFILGNQPTPPPKVAFVTSRDVDFGLARMLEVYRFQPTTLIRTFRSYEEAVCWASTAGT
jgi:hypothetical protein